jgi:hypothetical protein
VSYLYASKVYRYHFRRNKTEFTYHFVDANFEDTLKVRIDGLGKDPIETKLIHVQARGMPVVKDLGMAKSVRRGTVNIEVFGVR